MKHVGDLSIVLLLVAFIEMQCTAQQEQTGATILRARVGNSDGSKRAFACFCSMGGTGFSTNLLIAYCQIFVVCNRYRDNRHVSMGAEKWLDIELWNSPSECFTALKKRGYRIATARLGTDSVWINVPRPSDHLFGLSILQ